MNNLRDKDTNNGEEEVSNRTSGGSDVNAQPVDLQSLSFFNSDPYFNFVYKKSERLCMAIYLITDFFPAEDSIKDNMRKSGTDLLKVSLSLITASSSYRKNILNNISSLCLEIVSLSKVASNLGMTSAANHEVLEGEIRNFIGVIEERERPSTTGQGFVLNGDSYYHVEEKREVKANNPTVSSAASATTGPTNNPTTFERKVSHPIKSEKNEGVEIAHKHENAIKPLPTVQPAQKSVMQKNERQQIILDIIKEIGESSIKDISDNIKDCSEKTIQRELNTLIYDGVLKKIGERRWSKYILA